MGVGDILFILFRHKWKIILLSSAGIVGALAIYLFAPQPWSSEGKLVIRYVLESKPLGSVVLPGQPVANDSKSFRSPDARGENIINSEIEILTSQDLALLVADLVGPEKILGKSGGQTNRFQAASYIVRHLKIEVPKKSNVIAITFQHSDMEIVQQVLNQLMDLYIKRQADNSKAGGVFDEFLTKQTDQLRSRLERTEGELRKARTNAGIVSVMEDTQKGYNSEISRIRQAIMEAESELAQRQAEALELSKLMPASAQTTTNSLSNTNSLAPPADKIAEYKRLSNQLESQTKRAQEWRLQFAEGSSPVKSSQALVEATEKLKKQLEEEYPGLLAIKVTTEQHNSAMDPAVPPRAQLVAVAAQAAAAQSKIKSLTNQLAQVRQDVASLANWESEITQLGRQKELEEAQYKYFAANLEQARINEQLGNSKDSNITVVQAASVPFKDGKKLQKLVAAVLFIGIGAGLGLAFAFELFLDQSVKRPIEVETKLQLPLFISIPRLHLNGKVSRKALKSSHTPLIAERAGEQKTGDKDQESMDGRQEAAVRDQVPSPSAALNSLPMAPWDSHRLLRPFLDALRDRLITYFEVNNLTHKPKLVAVTSCGDGAGVTKIAAGLAASLSETGEGNVLLVDMNELGAAHPFYRGNPAFGLEEALELERRNTALVQGKLYAVSENRNGGSLPRSMPKHFQYLVPKLKASDYDYIIFDMPPISQISVTSKLARFMDITLVVVEAEETDREVVKRASSFLTQSGAKVGVVLNKTRTYGPRRLSHEL
jgi:uncharacterized protein involved in exopolysaccharide biosynthesis/Mrp family chromosome partitioning ATPase